MSQREEKLMPFPANLDAEEDVIGSILDNPTHCGQVFDILEPEDFYRDAHHEIFDAARTLYRQQREPNILNIKYELRRRDKLDAIGGDEAFSPFQWRVASLHPIEDHAYEVKRESTCRKLALFGMELYKRAYAREQDLLESAEKELYQIALGSGSATGHDVGMTEVMLKYLEILDERRYNYSNGIANGIPTGFTDVDRMIGGLQPGELAILGARPSVGKTALALNMARNIVTKARRVLFFSLEMNRYALAQRLLSMEVPMDQANLRDGDIDDDQMGKITDMAGKLSQVDLRIDDRSRTLSDIKSTARRVHGAKPVNLIVLDYLQLVKTSTGGRDRHETRAEEVAQISRDLKELSMELNVPILALAQLKRDVESRQDKTPQLSDLKESGGIEQDADTVMFLHVEKEQLEKRMKAENYYVQVVVSKQRNGRLGMEQLEFKPRSTRFVDVDFFPEPEIDTEALS
jgi:replicative DNA helicase